MGIRFKVNRWIAVSQPRSEKQCCVCSGLIKNVGLIIYLRHETTNIYTWVHLHCILDMKTKLEHKHQSNKFSYHCSFCEKNDEIPMVEGAVFRIHPACVDKLYVEVKKLCGENNENIMSELV